jgi:hypothetical protein
MGARRRYGVIPDSDRQAYKKLRALSFEPRGASTGRALAMRKLNIISAGFFGLPY